VIEIFKNIFACFLYCNNQVHRDFLIPCFSNIFWRDDIAERDVATCICGCNTETTGISFVRGIKGMEKKHSSDIV
jgi:hypothetical protein